MAVGIDMAAQHYIYKNIHFTNPGKLLGFSMIIKINPHETELEIFDTIVTKIQGCKAGSILTRLTPAPAPSTRRGRVRKNYRLLCDNVAPMRRYLFQNIKSPISKFVSYLIIIFFSDVISFFV